MGKAGYTWPSSNSADTGVVSVCPGYDIWKKAELLFVKLRSRKQFPQYLSNKHEGKTASRPDTLLGKRLSGTLSNGPFKHD